MARTKIQKTLIILQLVWAVIALFIPFVSVGSLDYSDWSFHEYSFLYQLFATPYRYVVMPYIFLGGWIMAAVSLCFYRWGIRVCGATLGYSIIVLFTIFCIVAHSRISAMFVVSVVFVCLVEIALIVLSYIYCVGSRWS